MQFAEVMTSDLFFEAHCIPNLRS